MKIYFDISDIEKCIEFSVKYFLDKSKAKSNRTTGQYRGLGSIINDFCLGKLIEIGVQKAIEQASPKKKILLDFELHSLTAENRADPDIIGVNENKINRKPKLHIEIKNISSTDKYIGLTNNQFNTIKSNPSVDSKTDNIFLVYANLSNNNTLFNNDTLGVFFKQKIKSQLYEKFCDIPDLFVDIKYVLKGNELEAHGVNFNVGSFFYETEVVSAELNERQISIMKNRDKKVINVSDGELPIFMRNKSFQSPKEFGKFYFQGEADLNLIENDKSYSVYLVCKTNANIKNNFLGTFPLKKGAIYSLKFDTIGRDPTLKRDNLWIATRNITAIVGDVKERILEISEKI